MAYVLSVPAHSPLKRAFSETPYLRSTSPLSNESVNTVRRCKPSNVSATSLISLTSVQTGPWLKANENAHPHATSRSLLDLIHELSTSSTIQKPDDCFPEKISWVSNIPLPPSPNARGMPGNATCPVHIEEPDDSCSSSATTFQDETDSESESICWPLEVPDVSPVRSSASSTMDDTEHVQDEPSPDEVTSDETMAKATPFKRWVSTLRRRNKDRSKGLAPRVERWTLDGSEADLSNRKMERNARESGHKKSSSLASSLAFVTAVKSASVTLASTSIAPLTRMGTKRSRGSHGHQGSEARITGEMTYPSIIPVMDERALERAKHRRRTLEEIIASEEGYIGDLKVLVNVYFTVLASVPSVSAQTRTAIHRNVSQILQLHEDLLGELHKVIPNSEYTHHDDDSSQRTARPKHTRWHSVDIVPGRAAGLVASRRQQRHSMDICNPPEPAPVGMTAETKTVADVARVFDKFMKRFFAYEEYSAQFESVSSELETSHKTIPAWHSYERGIEALSSTLVSVNQRDASCKKGLTLADLLIKPIQRPSKYPLFFTDLLKHTPVADDPVAHGELEKVYFRLKDANQEINNAKDDPRTRKLIETTWLLQDRLVFSDDQALPRALLTRLLGHVVLCGVLHVSYQTSERIEGKYMICILFKSCLLLAQTDKSYSNYHVVATITLANGSIEQPDSGRGLQCHTAPFSWKLGFESGHRLYEVILSACSAKEEEAWTNNLRTRITAENNDLIEGRSSMQDLFSSLSLDLKSIGSIFGQPNSFTRRMSIRRAATLGPKTNLQQVIIKNTQAQKRSDATQSATALPVVRSQSHLAASTLIPTLAPRRGERIRLETAIGDVWTKDSLPYPGMGPRRGDNPIRASANSVMRKLSMASITSNFSKRSGSYTSLSQLRKDDPGKPRKKSPPASMHKPATPEIKVDFHSAPAAFLPADFELMTPNNKGRRRGNRANFSERGSERTSIVAPGLLPRAMNLSPQPGPHAMALSKKLSMPTLAESPTTPRRSSVALSRRISLPSLTERPALDGTVEVRFEDRKPERQERRLQPQEGAPWPTTPSPLTKRFVKPRTRLFKFWTTRNEAAKAALASSKAFATTPF